MIVPRAPQRLATTVGQRLLLGLAPALLAVVLVLILSYYGEFGRQAPEYVVSGAAVLAVLSLLLTWLNTRHLTLRIRRLAGSADGPAASSASSFTQTPSGRMWRDDDLSRIEQELSRLNAATQAAETMLATERELYAHRLSEHATVQGAALRDALQQLESVRLPVHILIDAPFGELNDNQEELLVSARAAATEMHELLRRLVLISDADRDAIPLSIERVSLNDVVRSVLPMLRATVARRSAQLRVTLDPSLPRVLADRTRLAEALALLGIEAARDVAEGEVLDLTTRAVGADVELRFTPALGALTSQRLLGERLVTVQRGRVAHDSAVTTVRLSAAAGR